MAHESWLSDVVNPKGLTICAEELAKRINEDKEFLKINSITITGFSGSPIGGVVSYLTSLPLILVRKDEQRHSIYDVEFDNAIIGDAIRYCIVDDFICGGHTIKRIFEKVKEANEDAELIKIYLYRDKRLIPDFEIDEVDYPISYFLGSNSILHPEE